MNRNQRHYRNTKRIENFNVPIDFVAFYDIIMTLCTAMTLMIIPGMIELALATPQSTSQDHLWVCATLQIIPTPLVLLHCPRSKAKQFQSYIFKKGNILHYSSAPQPQKENGKIYPFHLQNYVKAKLEISNIQRYKPSLVGVHLHTNHKSLTKRRGNSH